MRSLGKGHGGAKKFCTLMNMPPPSAAKPFKMKKSSNTITKAIKVKSAFGPSGPSDRRLSQVSVAWSDQEYFYSTLDGMPVHRKVTPSIKFAGTHLYNWVKGTVRVKCLAQEHNTMSPNTDHSIRRRAHHKGIAPPTKAIKRNSKKEYVRCCCWN